MKKAADDMKAEAAEQAKIKHAEIEKRVPKLVLDGLNQGITPHTAPPYHTQCVSVLLFSKE